MSTKNGLSASLGKIRSIRGKNLDISLDTPLLVPISLPPSHWYNCPGRLAGVYRDEVLPTDHTIVTGSADYFAMASNYTCLCWKVVETHLCGVSAGWQLPVVFQRIWKLFTSHQGRRWGALSPTTIQHNSSLSHWEPSVLQGIEGARWGQRRVPHESSAHTSLIALYHEVSRSSSGDSHT